MTNSARCMESPMWRAFLFWWAARPIALTRLLSTLSLLLVARATRPATRPRPARAECDDDCRWSAPQPRVCLRLLETSTGRPKRSGVPSSCGWWPPTCPPTLRYTDIPRWSVPVLRRTEDERARAAPLRERGSQRACYSSWWSLLWNE